MPRGQWRKLPADMALGACVQTLFNGRCERPGGGDLWPLDAADTLRLTPGKVEDTQRTTQPHADNHTSRTAQFSAGRAEGRWPGCPARFLPVIADLNGCSGPVHRANKTVLIAAFDPWPSCCRLGRQREERTEPPGDPGICYHVVAQKDGKLKYNKLVAAPNLETCAANLEAMRIKFLTLGGSQQEIYGAYQANFLFLQTEGVLTSTRRWRPRAIRRPRAHRRWPPGDPGGHAAAYGAPKSSRTVPRRCESAVGNHGRENRTFGCPKR